MRDYEIYDNRVTLYNLVPFKNHACTQYRRKVIKCMSSYCLGLKIARAIIWVRVGI